jgi:membrane fusion protein, heavy metal efflux system
VRRLALAVVLVAAGGSTLLTTSCGRSEPPPPAAKPASAVAKEGELLTVTLTPEAEQRLGLRTAAAEMKNVERTRSLGGDVQIPPGRTAAVAAPLAGTIGGNPPAAGQRVRKGQAIFTLTPFLSAESRASLSATRIEAEGALEGAKVQLAAAKIAFERAERLLQDKAGSQRAVDEARAQRDGAQASVKAAETRRDLLGSAIAGTLGPVALEAPFDGVLRKVLVAAGEAVTAGTPLYEVADLSRLWIRIPVFVGDLRTIDASKAISIEGQAAKPISAPPSADPLTATADLFYELESRDDALRPGQKVTAALPLRGEAESLVVPWSAILHDIHGGTWVYEKIADHKFTRRRVQVKAVTDKIAVLTGGIKPGTPVVTEGVPELFGTEFGHAR